MWGGGTAICCYCLGRLDNCGSVGCPSNHILCSINHCGMPVIKYFAIIWWSCREKWIHAISVGIQILFSNSVLEAIMPFCVSISYIYIYIMFVCTHIWEQSGIYILRESIIQPRCMQSPNEREIDCRFVNRHTLMVSLSHQWRVLSEFMYCVIWIHNDWVSRFFISLAEFFGKKNCITHICPNPTISVFFLPQN